MEYDIKGLADIELVQIIKDSQMAKDEIYKVYFEPLEEFLKSVSNRDNNEEITVRVLDNALYTCYRISYFSSFEVWLLTWVEGVFPDKRIARKKFFDAFQNIRLKGEKKLLKTFLRGQDGITRLYKKYEKYVEAKLIQVGVASKDLEDVTQEVFQIAFSSIGTLRKPEAFRGWLARIASNYGTRFASTQKKKNECSLDFICENVYGEMDKSLCNMDTPLKKTLMEEEIKSLKKCFNELEEEYRSAIFLRYIDGMNYKKIAGIMGIDITVAYRRVSYGLQKLREALKRDGEKDV